MSLLPIIRMIVKTRKQKGYSQAALGEKLGLPQSHISAIETGRVEPRLYTLLEIVHALGCDLMLLEYAMVPYVRSLLKGEDPTQQPLWQVDQEE